MDFHEAANIFPLDEENLEALAEDIRKHGQQCPIEICDGKILDGRRRWSACEQAGIKPVTTEVNPDDPVAYVLSLNLHRRHLTPSQRAMCAQRARAMYDERAKERKIESGKSHGRGKVVENLPQPITDPGKARDEVGKAFGVSGRTVDHAKRVIEHGTPALVKAVDSGSMGVSAAAILTTEPPEVQDREATNPRRNRTYQSVSNPLATKTGDANASKQSEPPPGQSRGVGIERAHEAIACLKRIPKNDGLRKRGFQVVTDWIRHNQ